MQEVKCPYCGGNAVSTTGKHVYPHRNDLTEKLFYICMPCLAFVGCHPGTKKPLGTLANSELRKMRLEAHKTFDPIWKEKLMSRTEAYLWLGDKLNKKEVHIGSSDIELCQQIIKLSKEKRTAQCQ